MGTVVFIKSKPQWRKELGRFARFLVVGVSGTLLDFAILSALKYFLGWQTLLANLISYSCGIINNYILTRYWIYPESRSKQSFVQLMQFALISLVGLGLNNALMLALEEPAGKLLSNPAYGYIPAKIIATMIVLLWNFFANRLWTFNKPSQPKNLPIKDTKLDEFYDRSAA
jgi:putative flippase GtrA